MRRFPLVFVLAIPLSLAPAQSRPNILFCISDDQSYEPVRAVGESVLRTPAFDRVAREGLRFTLAFCDSPSCGPSRSAILTGQHIWRLEEAGNIHSTLPKKFATYTELLEGAGYVIGFTGKGWSPGRLEPGGRVRNPAGAEFVKHKLKPRIKGMSNKDYARNFEDFLAKRAADKPFCFWLGTHEPHRGYKLGAGVASGKDPSKVVVPPHLPDHQVVRRDLLDYYVEVEHFDSMVGRALATLEKAGELDNTIVVVTSDHGMPFPRAKASLYDAGTRVPLAIRWPKGIDSPGRVFTGLVNLSDLAPTFLEAAGLQPPEMMTAHSLMDVLASADSKPRDSAYIAMERHDGCRRGGKGYPCRAIRTQRFLYISNLRAGRWPAGDPDASVCARAIPFGEVDSSPTKTLLMDKAEDPEFRRFHALAFAKRPAEELYDLSKDPGQIRNLASDRDYAADKTRLSSQLQGYLKDTLDPRALGLDAPWDYYPYYGRRTNKDWKVDARAETGTETGAKAKIVFISGKPSHSRMKHEHRAGNMLLAKALNASGLQVKAVLVPHFGYPKDPSILEDAATVVVFCTGHRGHLLNQHMDDFDALMKKGTGVVMIHWATEAEKGGRGDKFLEWMGGFCDLHWSVNPHWTPKFSDFPDHPICNGVKPFSVNDEWYYHMRFVAGLKGVTPILSDLPGPRTLRRRDGARSGNPTVRKAVAAGKKQHVAWAYQRPGGGRGFGFTGAHNHVSWQNDDFRRVVLNAILWTAQVEVPKVGCPIAGISKIEIEANLDPKKKRP